MDWSNERYVRVYTRDTESWLELSWQARSLFVLLLRKVDRSGVLEARHGAQSVAFIVGMPPEVAEPALAELVADGCVEVHGGRYVVPNFLEAQEAPQSDRHRQRESRARRRDAIRAGLPAPSREGVVYFIQGEDGGPIKIGHAADLAKRLLQLQVCRPERLVVLAAVPGTLGDERKVHKLCAGVHERGEWFDPTPGLIELVKALGAQGADLDTVVTSRDWSRIVTGHKERDQSRDVTDQSRDVTDQSRNATSHSSLTSQTSQTNKTEHTHPPRARAIPGSADTAARESANAEPVALLARRALQETLWNAQQEARRGVGVVQGRALQDLPVTDHGRALLAERIWEQSAAGTDLAEVETRCRAVIARVVAECKRDGTVRYLDGSMWEQKRFDRALAVADEPVGPRKRPNGAPHTRRSGIGALLDEIEKAEAEARGNK